MSSIVSRIKEYIDFKKISVASFERSVGFSNSSFSSQYRNNRSIGSDKIENIIRIYPDINPVWLLTGKGNMIFKKEPILYEEVSIESSLSEPGAVYEKADNNSNERWLKSKIDTLIEDNTRNSKSIEKMVETSDRNSLILQQFVKVLFDNGLELPNHNNAKRGENDDEGHTQTDSHGNSATG